MIEKHHAIIPAWTIPPTADFVHTVIRYCHIHSDVMVWGHMQLISFSRQRACLLWWLAGLLISHGLSTSSSLAASAFAPPLIPVTVPGMVSHIQTLTLPNGQHLIVVEKHDQPIVTIDTWVKTGSVHETAQNNGVSHFLEHLLFKGTRKTPAGVADRLLESRGATFNAATSDDFTHFYITLPRSAFSLAAALHSDMLQHAVIPTRELDPERLVVQEEINRANDNPERQVFARFARDLFPGDPYGLETLGPKRTIAHIARTDILDYYHYWYQPSRFYTVIVGDVDARQVARDIAPLFPAPQHPLYGTYQPPHPDNTVNPVTKATAALLQSPTIQQSYWVIGWQGPSIRQIRDEVAMDAAMSALGSGRHSRLYRRLVEQEPLLTDVSAVNQTMARSGVLAISLTGNPPDWQPVRQAVTDMLRELKTHGITTAELDAFKTQTLKNWYFQNESTEGMASSIGYAVCIGSLSDYTQYVSRVQSLTVTEVNQAIRHWLRWPATVTTALVPTAKSETTQTATALNQQTLNRWLTDLSQADSGSRQVTAQPSHENEPHPVLADELKNGSRLLIKRLPDAQTVTIKLVSRGGQSMEAKPGIASLAASLLLKGTQSRSAEAISDAIESQGMSISVSSHEDVWEVTGSCTANDTGTLLNLMTDLLTHSRFDSAELEKAKQRLKASILASRDVPASRANELLLLRMFPDHPYGDVGQRVLDALPTITAEDIRAFVRQSLQPERQVWVVVGHVTPTLLTPALNQLVLELPDSSPDEKSHLVAVNKTASTTSAAPGSMPLPLSASESVVEDRATGSAAAIVQAWLAPGIGGPDYAALKVMNALLGTGMSSRLFVDLREKHGLAYTVGSVYPGLKLGSRLVMSTGTDPKNRAAIEAGFMQEAQRLMEEPVSNHELEDAKAKVMGQFALAHETPAEQAYFLGLYEAVGVGYEYDLTYPQQVSRVSASDVKRVARLVFQQPSISVVVTPKTP